MERAVIGLFIFSLIFFFREYQRYTKVRWTMAILPEPAGKEEVESAVKGLREGIEGLEQKTSKEKKKIAEIEKEMKKYEED